MEDKKIVFADSKISEKCAQSLEKSGFELVKIPENTEFDAPVSSHPDIFMIKIGNDIVCYKEIKHLFDKKKGQYQISEPTGFEKEKYVYPDDCKLNFALCGNKLIGKYDNADEKIKELAQKYNLKAINVNQGYAKCNICVVDDNSIITEDKGIYKECSREGMDVLLLENHEVILHGYKNGFIGGASGLCDNTLYFCGNVDLHSEHDKIYNFCKARGISVVSLSDETLYDCGSLIFI
jgi:hypothetical protein